MKIKSKIIINFGTILIVSAIIFNIFFRRIMINQMENSIKDSMTQIMNTSSESIKYRIFNNSFNDDNDKLKSESEYLVKYLSVNIDGNVEIRNKDNMIISSNIDKNYIDIVDKLNEKTQNNKSIMHIKYSKDKAYVIISYTIYNYDNKLGTCNIMKDYSDTYLETINTISTITILEIIIFVLIFIVAFLITTAVIKPIASLTEGVKKIENGDYDFPFNIKRKDEVGILSREFVNMKNKIKIQLETINKEKSKVEALSNHRKEFFDNLTHEIKTPLTAITGYAEMLKEGMVIDEKFEKRAINRIYLESERVNRLVLDLIAVSKGLSENIEESKVINAKTIIDPLVEDLQIKADKYSLDIISKVLDGDILVQEDRIKQVFINLIDNAIKYTYGDNKIYVNGSVKEDKYIFTVKNKCQEIPEDVCKNIFDPFVKTNKENEKYSSGLGLYISKEIVEEIHGTVEVSVGEYFEITASFEIIGGDKSE